MSNEDIPLGGESSGPPGVKFEAIGEYVDIALVNLATAPWNDYATGKPKLTDDGKPRSQEVLQGVVIRGTAHVGKNSDPLPVGELVRLFIAGHRRWTWGEAKTAAKEAMGRGIVVGDVIRITYTKDEPGKGTQDKKVWEYRLRAHKPEEAAQTAHCRRLHKGAQDVPVGAGQDDNF